jgi:hypothetical protein
MRLIGRIHGGHLKLGCIGVPPLDTLCVCVA